MHANTDAHTHIHARMHTNTHSEQSCVFKKQQCHKVHINTLFQQNQTFPSALKKELEHSSFWYDKKKHLQWCTILWPVKTTPYWCHIPCCIEQCISFSPNWELLWIHTCAFTIKIYTAFSCNQNTIVHNRHSTTLLNETRHGNWFERKTEILSPPPPPL